MSAHPPGLLWSLTDYSHEVDYSHFALIGDGDDDDDVEHPDLGTEGPGDSVLATSGESWIALRSGGSGHNPTITLQAWEHEPPAEERTWGDQAELGVEFVSGALRLWGVASGPSQGPPFVLPEADGGFLRVRVHRRSGTESRSVADLVVDLADDEDYEDGIWDLEEWLLQFWPAGS